MLFSFIFPSSFCRVNYIYLGTEVKREKDERFPCKEMMPWAGDFKIKYFTQTSFVLHVLLVSSTFSPLVLFLSSMALVLVLCFFHFRYFVMSLCIHLHSAYAKCLL